MKSYRETGTIWPKPILARKHSVRTKRLVGTVRKKLSRNPRRSIRKMAKDIQTSPGTICRFFKRCLGQKLLKIGTRTTSAFDCGTIKSKAAGEVILIYWWYIDKILQEMQSAGDNTFIWTGKKIFTMETGSWQQFRTLSTHLPILLKTGTDFQSHHQ